MKSLLREPLAAWCRGFGFASGLAQLGLPKGETQRKRLAAVTP